MGSKRLKVASQLLVPLLFTTLVVPAWAAPPVKKTMYGKVAIVAVSGGDYTNPVTAMANTAAWCGTPSATNPCLMKIMAGVYDLAGGSLSMQPYVDIEGAGETATVILSQYSTSLFSGGVVNGADNAEIRFLTVYNNGSGEDYSVAIANSSQSPKITHVTAIGSGYGAYGIYNESSSPNLNDVTAIGDGGRNAYGIYNNASSPFMTNVTAKAFGKFSFGIFNVSSSPTMTNVTVAVSGDTGCVGVRNDASSPTMSRVTVIASSGPSATGVENISSSSIMTDVVVTASGGSSIGISNKSSSPVMTNVTATAAQGSTAIGVENTSSSPTMTNVTARAVNGVNCYGMTTSSDSAVTLLVDRSTFEGTSAGDGISMGFTNGSNVTLRIGASKIVGSITNNGTLTCTGSYNGNYAAVGTNCQ